MIKLIAHVSFYDVDGNKINKYYDNKGYMDLNELLDSISYHITDTDEFTSPQKHTYKGVNGIVDITRKIQITIYPEMHNKQNTQCN